MQTFTKEASHWPPFLFFLLPLLVGLSFPCLGLTIFILRKFVFASPTIALQFEFGLGRLKLFYLLTTKLHKRLHCSHGFGKFLNPQQCNFCFAHGFKPSIKRKKAYFSPKSKIWSMSSLNCYAYSLIMPCWHKQTHLHPSLILDILWVKLPFEFTLELPSPDSSTTPSLIRGPTTPP